MVLNVALAQISRYIIQTIGKKFIGEAVKRGIRARIQKDVLASIVRQSIKDTAIDQAIDTGIETAINFLSTEDASLEYALSKAIDEYLNDPLIKTGDRSLDFVVNTILNFAFGANDIYKAGKILVDKKGAIQDILKRVRVNGRKFEEYVEHRVRGHVNLEVAKAKEAARIEDKAAKEAAEAAKRNKERLERQKQFEEDMRKKWEEIRKKEEELRRKQKELGQREKRLERREREFAKKVKAFKKMKKALKRAKNLKRVKRAGKVAKGAKQAKKMRRAVPGIPANRKIPTPKSYSPYWKWIVWCPTFAKDPWRRVVSPGLMTAVEIVQSLLAEAGKYNDSDRIKLMTALRQWAPNSITIYGYAPGNSGRHTNADMIISQELDEETIAAICGDE